MLMSEKIAEILEEMLREHGGTAEICRNDFAERVGCVPSQINYVLSSRFSKNHGYLVESRRGGGGYIKITRLPVDKSTYLMHLYGSVGDTLSAPEAQLYLSALEQNGFVASAARRLFAALLSDESLRVEKDAGVRNALRADLFKTVLLGVISENGKR